MEIDQKHLDRIQKTKEIFSKPLDVDKHIADGTISRYKNRKTLFVVHCPADKLPEEISIRTKTIKSITQKDGTSLLVLGLNMKVIKF